MATTNIWYVDSTMIIELRNLTDGITGDAVTTATVRATLLDETGSTPVAGVNWPVTLPHVEEGTYRGNASYAAQVVDRGKYVCRIVASVDGIQRRWDIPVAARIDNK